LTYIDLQRDLYGKEALAILETKRSQIILDSQAITTGYILKYKIKSNFLDYYAEYVRPNPSVGNSIPFLSSACV